MSDRATMTDREILRSLMHNDLGLFARRAMSVLQPSLKLEWNWHLDLMVDRLLRLGSGEIRRLIINVPPRSLKSLLCSVIYPAWLLGRDPYIELVCLSYAQGLGEDFSRQCRKLIESESYRAIFDTRLAREKRAVDQFETTMGGRRLTASVGGTVTGRGGDMIILDDPMKPEEAMSEAGRKTANDWLRSTLMSRPNHKKTGRMLAIMQRLHGEDATAELLRNDDWTLLSLPAIAIEREEHHYTTARGSQVYVREAGEPLHPEREGIEELDRLKAQMGTMVFAAQYQQQPMAAEGNMLKRSWIKRYAPHDIFAPELIIQSWDTASKTGQLNDFSVGTTWFIKGRHIYLVDVCRARLEQPALQQRIIDLARQYQAQVVLIEDKGSGTGLLQGLAASYFYQSVAIQPRGEKSLRFVNVTPMFENGTVLLPEHAPWLDEYTDELCGFPSTKHDDQVDSTSQALMWLQDRLTTPSIIEHYRRENERRIAYAEDRTVHMRAPAGVNQVGMKDGHNRPVGPDGTIWVTAENAGWLSLAGFARLSG